MDVREVAVLGSGIMGHGIAQISAAAGYDVVLRDVRQEFLDAAMEKIRWSLDKMVSGGKIGRGEGDAVLGRIRPAVDLGEAVGGAQLVVEAVPESMELKRRVYAELDEAIGGRQGEVVLASNTSTLPITEVAGAAARPDMFIGIHFFNPPQLMKLVEIIPGEKTSPRVVELAREYVRSVGKEGITCGRDIPGFIVNRLFIPMVHEACYCMDRTGAPMEAIDSAVKFRLGFPMGIFELADFTGIDVIHKATSEMHLRDRKVVRPHPAIGRMFGEKRLGQKSGGGFYDYPGGKYRRAELSEDLAGGFDPVQLAANVLNNAAWLVTNGAGDVEKIERAAGLGLGLRRPLFETAREIGIRRIVDELNGLAGEDGEFYRPDRLLESMA